MKIMEPNTAPLAFLLALGLLCGVAGCNTTAGIGEDVEATGDAIENAADEAEEDLES